MARSVVRIHPELLTLGRPENGRVGRRHLAWWIGGAAALASAGCGTGDAGAGSWHKAPAAPLSPREEALGIWTGREALVIGGSDAPPCPGGASCGRQDTPPLRDGAAFNPRTRSWRRIAAAPVGFDFAEGAVVGRTVFVATPGSNARPGAPSAVLAYRVDRNRWRRLPSPPDPKRNYTLLAAGDRLVVYDRGGGCPTRRPFSTATTGCASAPG